MFKKCLVYSSIIFTAISLLKWYCTPTVCDGLFCHVIAGEMGRTVFWLLIFGSETREGATADYLFDYFQLILQ